MNATHGAAAPHILAPTMTPPATGQTAPFSATQTFLIEASRSNSLIDTADGGDFNAKWTNSTNFNLRRGDRISVEMCAFNAANAGGGVPTIELTGEKAKAQGETKPYCDNKVLLEIFFYLNNNNTYSVGFPCKFPTGMDYTVPTIVQNVNWANAAPFNLKGINGGANDNGCCDYNNVAPGLTGWGNHKIPQSRSKPQESMSKVVGYSGWGEGFGRPMLVGGGVAFGLCPPAEAYTVFQFHRQADPAGTYVNALAAGDICDGVVLAKTGDPNPGGGLFCDYIGYYTGRTTTDINFNGLIGMGSAMVSTAIPNTRMLLNTGPVVDIVEQKTGAGLIGQNRVELRWGTPTAPGVLPFVPTQGTSFIYFNSMRTMASVDPYIKEGLILNAEWGGSDYGNICYDNTQNNPGTNLDFYRKRGGIFQCYNEFNIGYNSLALNSPEMRRFPGNVYGNYANGVGFAGLSIMPPDVSTGATPTVTGKNNLPGIYHGCEGYRNGNLMKENNNKPYILTRNDYYGMARMMPNMRGYMPYLKPQTAFILLDAAELFTDLTTLANRINDILHQRLPYPSGSESGMYDDYILNQQQYARTYKKGSSVIPYGLLQGYYDPQQYDGPAQGYRYFTDGMKLVWDTILPISSGGSIKIQPANFQVGYDFALTHTNKQVDNINLNLVALDTPAIKAQILVQQENTYCRSVTTAQTQPFAHSNICYGNMCYENMPKMMFGDCWRRLPTFAMWSPESNSPAGAPVEDGLAALSMPVILNTKLAYYNVNAGQIYNMRTQALSPGSVIFTNIWWLGAGPLDYDWKLEAESFDDYGYNDNPSTGSPAVLFRNLADSIRRYEIYTRQDDPSASEGKPAKPTWAGQEKDDEGWSVEMDLGCTDDDANMLGYNNTPADPAQYVQGMYHLPAGFGGPDAANDTLANGWFNKTGKGKRDNMIADVPAGIIKYPQAANPNVAVGGDNYWGTGQGGNSPVANAIDRDFICPSQSNAVFGSSVEPPVPTELHWSNNFKTLRGVGRIKMRSRPTKDYFKKDAAGNFVNLVPFQQEPLPVWGGSLPAGPAPPAPPPMTADTMCEICDPERLKTNEFGTRTAGTLEYFENLGLPFIPYIHTSQDGVKRLFCAMVVANRYRALEYQPNTWELGEICWGTALSVSASFYDNHAIVPMNGDAINFRNPLADKYGTGSGSVGAGNCAVQPNRNIARNNFNYIFIGAPNPTFQWSPEKNRFEFINFQQDTLFSAFTTTTESVAQQGEPCVILNSSTEDAVFSIIDPYQYAPTQIDPANSIAAGAADRTNIIGNIHTIPNQGVRDAEGGIGIWNIWLCPPDYEFPPGLNPVNYWSQETDDSFDNNWDVPHYLDVCEQNHQRIVKGCVKASRKIWEGSLLYKLGFTPEQIAEPYYGKQTNRYNPSTFNNTNPNVIGTGVKPLLLGNTYDNTQNPATNINYKWYVKPQPSTLVDYNGLPKFSSGLQNNQPVAVSTIPQPLTATDSPILTDSPFYLVYSNICETHYQSGATSQPALFYVMRNYPNQGYFYGGGSNYYQICNQDRVLSQVTTEVRNPATGELAKLSPNSVLMYKIERDIVVPAPTIDATGQMPDAEGPQTQPDPTAKAIEDLTAELGGETRTAGGRPAQPGNPGGAAGGVGGGGPIQTQNAPHAAAVSNWVVEPDGAVVAEDPAVVAMIAAGGGSSAGFETMSDHPSILDSTDEVEFLEGATTGAADPSTFDLATYQPAIAGVQPLGPPESKIEQEEREQKVADTGFAEATAAAMGMYEPGAGGEAKTKALTSSPPILRTKSKRRWAVESEGTAGGGAYERMSFPSTAADLPPTLNEAQQAKAQIAMNYVIKQIVSQVPLTTGTNNRVADYNTLPVAIVNALENSNLVQLISSLAADGASSSEIVDTITPSLQDIRFGRAGQIVHRELTNRPNAILVFAGGRGRNLLGRISQELLGNNNPAALADLTREAIQNGGLVGERREERTYGTGVYQFNITRDGGEAARPYPARGADMGAATPTVDMTRTRTPAERERVRRGEGEHHGRRIGEERKAESDRASSDRYSSGATVSRHGSHIGRVSSEGSGRRLAPYARSRTSSGPSTAPPAIPPRRGSAAAPAPPPVRPPPVGHRGPYSHHNQDQNPN